MNRSVPNVWMRFAQKNNRYLRETNYAALDKATILRSKLPTQRAVVNITMLLSTTLKHLGTFYTP